MCGISGIVNFDSPEEKTPLLSQMLGIMHYRGPDSTGIYTDRLVGLGHTRLSIIDLEGGDQPIHNEDKTVWVILNGEIFNYPELRKELLEKGHHFYTLTDTEVLVHLYEEKGVEMLSDLNGQYALAIWDTKEEKLLLARDRVGIRPLFYHLQNNRLLFASEIKALFVDRRIPRQLDQKTMSEIFTTWTQLEDKTVFHNIYQLQPGHFAIFKRDDFLIKKYWQLPFAEDAPADITLNDATEKLESLLLDATRIRLRADVPVGAYLSGGIDSTYISSIVKNNFNNRLNTFSVSFTDSRFDETSYQKEAVSYLGTSHNSIQCSEMNIGDIFPKITWHTETPLFRTAPAPLYLLSKLVRKNDFKVVLTGEGADEMFAGYNIFKEDCVRRFMAKRPESSLRPLLLKRLYPYIFSEGNNKAIAFLTNFFKKNLTSTHLPYYSHLLRWNNTSKLQTFFTRDVQKNMFTLDEIIGKFSSGIPKEFMRWHPLSRAQYTETHLFLSNYLLSSQGDRMAMANSVEGRYPFLDYRVIEFACKLPPKFKMMGLNEKFLLKKAAQGKIPPQIIQRSKQPYRAPISRCFFGETQPDYVEELMSENKIKESGYFDPKKVFRLKEKCKRQGGHLLSERENMALVGIISTQLIHHQFIDTFQNYVPEANDNVTLYSQ